MKLVIFTILLVAISLLFLPPPQDDGQLQEEYWSLRSTLAPAPCGMLSAMTLNLRREGVESVDAHHFIYRRHRIAALFQRIRPTIIGTQEAFASQVHALLPLVPTHYSVVGYEGDGHHNLELINPIRRYDYRTAIWFDRRYFQLVTSDHVWLSSTQERDSRSWGSSGVRTMTVVLLRSLCAEQEELENGTAPLLLIFNTHLDVGVELARYEQAKLVARIIAEWQLQWPLAATILLGDFNSIPGQRPYSVLVSSATEQHNGDISSSYPARPFLHDAWSTCHTQDFASTFHNWMGNRVNSLGMRYIQAAGFLVHGCGLTQFASFGLWHSTAAVSTIPQTLLSLLRRLPETFALPQLNRMHVDWILYCDGKLRNSVSRRDDRQDRQTLKEQPRLVPRMVYIEEVSNSFSSDHFPVVALFEFRLSM